MAEFQHLNTEGVFDPSSLYTHVVVPPPGRVVFLSGQWGAAIDGSLVGTDFSDQVTQAFSNVRLHLEALGIGASHVLKLTHYVVDLDQERRAALHRVVGTIWPGDKPASTLVGVARLARDQMWYEVDVQAVLPD